MIEKSLVAGVVHVWSRDRAFDRSDLEKAKAAFGRFMKSHNLDDLKPIILEGQQPAKFHLVPIKRRQFLQVAEIPGAAGNCETVALSLRKVENFTNRGERVEVKLIDVDGWQRCDSETLDALYDMHLFAELAAVIVTISRIDP